MQYIRQKYSIYCILLRFESLAKDHSLSCIKVTWCQTQCLVCRCFFLFFFVAMIKLLDPVQYFYLFVFIHSSPHHWLMLCVHMCDHFYQAADGRGRERQREPTSTLEVPEQQRTPAHHIRSRSVSPHREEQGHNRSRPPNVPTQRWGLITFMGKKGMGQFHHI